MTEHRDAGWLVQLAKKDRHIQALQEQVKNYKNVHRISELQIQALQAAYEDTRDSLQRALAALAEHDARYRQQVQAKAERYHDIARQP
jgi:bifunctional pyridoxal-dependent enzyme with beta-cystathionase and maltose regulon repressor activities